VNINSVEISEPDSVGSRCPHRCRFLSRQVVDFGLVAQSSDPRSDLAVEYSCCSTTAQTQARLQPNSLI